MDLFEYMRQQNMKDESPLASRLRPTTLDEVVGQQHIVGKDKLLYRAIKADKLSSIIFYTAWYGKDDAGESDCQYHKCRVHADQCDFGGQERHGGSGCRGKNNQGMYGKKTILFIDEIHRFNKGQQDYLLPFVEDGTIILIGATTENPYFEVNPALLSRSVIFELKKLSTEDIRTLLLRAVNDTEKGMGSYHAQVDDDALEFLADMANGDARAALTAIELGILTTNGVRMGSFTLHWMWPVSAFRSGSSTTIRREIITMIRSLLLSRACVDQIRMPRCIIWHGCFMRGRCEIYCQKNHDSGI